MRFVDPPLDAKLVDTVRRALAKANAMQLPTFSHEDVAEKLAGEYVGRRKFTDIRAFANQFGKSGFSDPRITSTMAPRSRRPRSWPTTSAHVFSRTSTPPRIRFSR